MILDERNEFADGVAVSGAAATRQAGDVIDLSVARDIGSGQPIYLYILVEAAPTGADTVAFHLVSDSVNPPATDGSATMHYSTGNVAIADLPAGKRFMVALPLEDPAYERYLALQVTNAGASSLADLKVSAGLTLDPCRWKAYPEGEN
jgi:hypothetical protein